MNDLLFAVKNKKGLQGVNNSRQAYIFAKKSIKKAKYLYFGNKKAIIPIFFVSILWFLFGGHRWIRTVECISQPLIHKGFRRLFTKCSPNKNIFLSFRPCCLIRRVLLSFFVTRFFAPRRNGVAHRIR